MSQGLKAGYSVKLRGLCRTQRRLSIASASLHLKEHEEEIELIHTASKDQLGDLMIRALARPLCLKTSGSANFAS